jgi:UDP-GlcNAc3NAcA epimerase
MIKLLTIIGARPQIIKAAAISRTIKNHFADQLTEVIVHTGQHYDANMSKVFFDELNIPKENYNLQVGSGKHGFQTGEMISKLEKIFDLEKPSAVIVYGDTNSTLAGALTASKMHIPVLHVEAGMRSFNKKMPEEINRICCDHVSTLLFSPTLTGIQNLTREGFQNDARPPFSINNPKIMHCGDVMYDNSIYFNKLALKNIQLLKNLKLEENKFALCTIHRDSNTDIKENLESIFDALDSLSTKTQQPFVIPLHPRTSKLLDSQLGESLYKKIQANTMIKIIAPVSFLEMTLLESTCNIILTDSGGVQKESYFFKKPCVILRNETEWVELIENGTAILSGANTHKIQQAYFKLRQGTLNFPALFGDGNAAVFICKEIRRLFN